MRLTALLLLMTTLLAGEAGVIIPSGKDQPDEKVLSIGEMEIVVRIDAGSALVKTKQIFRNHSNNVLEGSYTFSLPSRATISDFAVWDDVVRIPGVILERRRAEEIYNIGKQQVIDPGLLQMGEHGSDEVRNTALFNARIIPIPAYGSKRVELEYQERLPVEQFQSYFALPLRPDAHRAVTAGQLTITIELTSPHPINDFQLASKAYGFNIEERTPTRIRGRWTGQNVTLSEDFAFTWRLDPSRADSIEVITHRASSQENGFLQASALIADRASTAQGAPRTVIALFDTSLSMQWEKLERSYTALERLLRSLRPSDQFGLVVFNTEATAFAPKAQPASPESIEKALAFIKDSRLRGGTDLRKAIETALPLAPVTPETYLVLLTDGGVTRGQELRSAQIAKWYAARPHPRTYIFAVGDDANVGMLRQLTGDNGVLEWIRSTEPPEFKLNSFLSKLGRRPVEGLALALQPAANFDFVYPLEHNPFPGALASWVGQYRQPGAATAALKGNRDGAAVQITATAQLPATSNDHPQLPRTWAKARVDALLEKIERDGEDTATIDEIIRLSRKYKFVTPYTSFLAAPRALLRPRVIRPGDPVLRVRTDESIASVVAMFPFGPIKSLRYLKDEDVWQTRFLAPSDMPDGTHAVRLVLRDRGGRVYRESKTFVIASKPPQVRARLERARYRPGERVRVLVSASESARTVIARMHGVPAVHLRWSSQDRASTGDFIAPAHLPPGRYTVEVTAEDFAHNIGRGEVQIEIIP